MLSISGNRAPVDAVSDSRGAQACSRRLRGIREATWTAPSAGLASPYQLSDGGEPCSTRCVAKGWC